MSASSRSGSNSTTSACGYCWRYFSIPTFIREWMMARKVCDRTIGRPPWLSLSTVIRPLRAAPLASNGTSGLTHRRRSTPSSSATDACKVLLSAPSTKYSPPIWTGGNRPGRAAEASMASDIGTRSRPGAPNITEAPVSRLVATRKSLHLSCRKSLVRPGAAKSRCRNRSIARLSNIPVGTACDSAPSDSMTPRRTGSCNACNAARSRSPGTCAARCANSANAGRRKTSGVSAASAPSSMKRRYICAGEMPFASAAATKPPDETPT